MRLWCVVLLLLSPLAAWPQAAAQRDYDPDTVKTLYFDSHGPQLHPPSREFPYQGVAVRTRLDANGVYEDRLVDIGLQQLRLGVRHEPALGRATLVMFYPEGHPRIRAQFLEDTAAAPPTEYLVPSLRRPLSAHALLDGEVTTFYPSGQVRQQALYRRGQRVRSQCFDFKNRPVTCNDNQLLIPAGLPASVYTGKKVKYRALIISDKPMQQSVTDAVFDISSQREMLRLRVFLNGKQLDTESADLARQHGQVPMGFVLDAQATSVNGINSNSGALNSYLRSLALNINRLFGEKGTMRPALLDGEPVTTYFKLPVQFELK